MHTSLKLFYSTSINYSYFDEEKDDLINLITSLFFRTGNLYESIYNLYSMSYSSEFEALQEKLNDLKNIKIEKKMKKSKTIHNKFNDTNNRWKSNRKMV